ncbi:MAG: hypothetical protein AB1449_07235 [Chloroflexota bacterium]
MPAEGTKPRGRGRWLLGLAAGLLALGLLASATVLVLVLPRPFAAAPTATATQPPPTLSPAPASPTLPADTQTAASGLPPEVEAEMDAIEAEVSRLRGLDPLVPVERVVLTPDELRQRVADELLRDYSPQQAQEDALLLSLLGAVEPGFDLWGLYQALYAEQVAGYYDDTAGVMYLVSGPSFGGAERLTYAHEYDHALQDQTYDLDQGLGYNPQACEADPERCRSLLALLEGDATLLSTQWLRTYASQDDLQQLQDYYRSLETPIFNAAPEFIQQDFLFPYLHGLNFVTDLYIEGNWPAVDAAYAQPPITTEQILHPERYPQDEPLLPEIPQDLTAQIGDGWREVSRGTLGEWTTRLALETQLPDATEACEGWGGDRYVVLANDASGERALVLLTRWDRFADAQEFFLAFQSYGQARFGQGTYSTYRLSWSSAEGEVLFERKSDQTLWLLAPTADVLSALQQAIPFPAPVP